MRRTVASRRRRSSCSSAPTCHRCFPRSLSSATRQTRSCCASPISASASPTASTAAFRPTSTASTAFPTTRSSLRTTIPTLRGEWRTTGTPSNIAESNRRGLSLGFSRKSFFLIALAVLALSVVAPARAQSPSSRAIPPGSFRASAGLAKPGFTIVEMYPSDEVPSDTARPAAALRGYGLEASEENHYARGADNLAVTLYRMKDPSGAYGEYTFLLKSEVHAQPAKI